MKYMPEQTQQQYSGIILTFINSFFYSYATDDVCRGNRRDPRNFLDRDLVPELCARDASSVEADRSLRTLT